MNKPLKIFISYSKEDKDLLHRFNQHVVPLIRTGVIETWKDTDLEAGSNWHYEIQKNLDEAELILFLVSASLLSTSYVYDVEMEKARIKMEKKEAIVIPIIIRHCCWDYTFFRLCCMNPV